MKRVLAMVIILTLVLMVSSIFSQDPFSSGTGEDTHPMPGVLEAPPGVEESPFEMYEPPLREEELYKPDCDCYFSHTPDDIIGALVLGSNTVYNSGTCNCISVDCVDAYEAMLEDRLEEIIGESIEISSIYSDTSPCRIKLIKNCYKVDELRRLSEGNIIWEGIYRRFEQIIKEDPSLQEVCEWEFNIVAIEDTEICIDVLVEVLSTPCSELE